MKEINQLAIVNIGGMDKDPETGTITAYYQVINPIGIATRLGGSSNASVYTYNFKDNSHGKFSFLTSTEMPRLFFTPHLQCYIVSERYARQGVLDLINFLELSPEGRANVFFFVTDSPISTVMNSFTTLDRVPGRHIRSLIENRGRGFETGVEPVRVKDMAKGLDIHLPTIVAIVHYTGEKPASKVDRLQQINASKDGMSFQDGAVFINARMVGRVNLDTKTYFFILNKNYKVFTESVKLNGYVVDVQTENIQIKREWDRPSNRLAIKVFADLRILNNQQKKDITVHNLHEVEKAFNRVFAQKSESLFRLGKEKGWDMLGVRDQGGDSDTSVTFIVNSKVTTTGSTSSPYITRR
jgi:hypothetical protein